MLRTLKQACLSTGRSCGLFKLASSSHFRNSRLLVLGYHGVSLEDEHRWDPSLFLSPDIFRHRMEALKRSACTVVSLEEGLDLAGRYSGASPGADRFPEQRAAVPCLEWKADQPAQRRQPGHHSQTQARAVARLARIPARLRFQPIQAGHRRQDDSGNPPTSGSRHDLAVLRQDGVPGLGQRHVDFGFGGLCTRACTR